MLKCRHRGFNNSNSLPRLVNFIVSFNYIRMKWLIGTDVQQDNINDRFPVIPSYAVSQIN